MPRLLKIKFNQNQGGTIMFEQLQKIVADKLGVDESEIKLDSSFTDDLGADSLDLFDIVQDLEEEFDVTVENEDLDKIKTIQDAINYIEAKKN